MRFAAMLIPVSLLLTSCTMSIPQPYIDDLSGDMIKIAVNFMPITGPSPEVSQDSADAIALDHCASYNRRSEHASSSVRTADAYGTRGTYYFLYRCLED